MGGPSAAARCCARLPTLGAQSPTALVGRLSAAAGFCAWLPTLGSQALSGGGWGCCRSVLILKNPSAMWSYDAWARPLEGTVWLILAATILSTVAVLRAVGYWEVRMVEGHAQEEDTWPAAVTTALSMICAQVGPHCRTPKIKTPKIQNPGIK